MQTMFAATQRFYAICIAIWISQVNRFAMNYVWLDTETSTEDGSAAMKTIYDKTLKATVILDDDNVVRAINHLDEYPEIAGARGRAAAAEYVRMIAGTYNIAPPALRDLDLPVSYLDPQVRDVEFHFSAEQPAFDSATYGYAQTYLNVPVWAAGITVTVKQAPARVLASANTSARGIDAHMPPAEAIERYRKLFDTGEKHDGAAVPASDTLLGDILGQQAAEPNQTSLVLIRGRFHVYRYVAAERSDDQGPPPPRMQHDPALDGPPPTLPLPPVDQRIEEGHWYLVAELVFRMPYQGGRMNWRMLVDVETNAILYLRALTAGVSGLVYTYDPITSTGNPANTPNQSNAVLNPHRDDVVLKNLNAPAGGVQSLAGTWAAMAETSAPVIAAPTLPAGSRFDYNVRTNDFAAVNAYYHVDRFFQLVADLGFPVAGVGAYFDGTAFPVEVDHRGLGNAINAQCVGDGDGIDFTQYALADTSDLTNPIGIACDWRVVLHELGGHGILHDHVGGPNFGFAHSAGDSVAMIMNDYSSEWHSGAPLDRFLLAPFVPAVVRRSDRPVSGGWGWGGANDVGGYFSEQILSTTLFRAYRSIGGDASSLTRRVFAARCMVYLLFRAVGTLTPMTNPSSPAQLLAALQTADAGNWTSEGIFGGAYGKVLRWAFEKQNLDGGAVPPTDVYIDDGRGGEYPYQPVHWATTTIWNRRNPDGMAGHQEPALGESNYAYVKIKNRGSSQAQNVIVKGFHCKPSAGILWPNDLQPFTTPQLSAGTLQGNNLEEKIVGPFEWTPVVNAWGHDCMLMIVSATGDPSNVDNFTAGESVEDWRLVPNDNNVAQRNVTLVPGGGGVKGLIAGLHGKGFWVGNPGRARAKIEVQVALPPLLAARGWRIVLLGLPDGGLSLKSGEQRLLTFDVHAGAPFTKADVLATEARDIVVTATADGAIIGGMVYHIDPELERPFNDVVPGDDGTRCREQAGHLLACLGLPADDVKCVRVRKVAIDVEMDDGSCGC